MTLVKINITNIASETHPDDKVVFSPPHVREHPEGGLVSTAETVVPLVDGIGQIELVPGPVNVTFQCRGISDTRAKSGTVPDTGTVDIAEVIEGGLTFTPPVVNRALELIQSERDHLLDDMVTTVSEAVDGELGATVRSAQTAATTAAQSAVESETFASNANVRATSAETVAGNALNRVSAVEVLAGLSPGDVSDATMANIALQPSSMFHGVQRDAIMSTISAISPDDHSDHTTLIQGALDALAVGGRGGTLTLLPGTYVISDTLSVPAKVSLVGSGQQSTVISATGIPSGKCAIHVATGTGAKLAHFRLVGSASRNSDGVILGRLDGETSGSVTDFIMDSVRVESFSTGIIARYSWCIRFVNTRMHICITGAQFGPQVNAISFNGSVTGFAERAFILNNAEGVLFDIVNIDSTAADGSLPAINLFQSQAVMTQPYIENISRLAHLGGTNESANTPSSLVIVNGRVSGTILFAGKGTQLTVTSPWLMASGTGTPFAIDVVDGNLGRQPRTISVDSMQASTGIQSVRRWDSRSDDWNIPNAYGGSGVTAVKNTGFHTVSSPSAGQGILIGNLTVGQQYVLSYRARKTDGTLNLRDGAGTSYSVSKVEDASSDFQVVHTPFIARGTALRMLWAGDLDLQWLSLVKGLHFLDRT